MPRDLKADMAMLQEVLNSAQNRDWPRAGTIAGQALASGFEHPLLLNVVATCLEHEGRFEDSLRLLQRAVTLAPQDVSVRNALSLCLQRLDRPGEALHHINEMLKRHPDLPYLHANKGNALIALGWLGRARGSHLRAVELEPGNLAAMAALASIASHRGNHDEARLWAEKVLAVVPNFPDAVVALAAAELAAGEAGKAETLLRRLLSDSRVVARDKARAQGLLGDVLDTSGRYAEAFAAYTECNEVMRQGYSRYGGNSVLEYARTLGAAIKNVDPRIWSTEDAADAGEAGTLQHVFLVGFPRSGTTLLEIVLDGHPRVVSLDEHELLTESVFRYMRGTENLDSLAQAGDAELATFRKAYWDRVRGAEVDPRGKVFVDKYPMNTLKLPLIARLFPRARILFAHRDPREVVLACYRRRFRMNAAMFELLTLSRGAALYEAVMEFSQQMRPVFGDRWRIVRYESLMAGFESEIRSICAFLGIEWVPGMDDFARRARERERTTPSTAQLARGLDRNLRASWKNYEPQLAPVLPQLNAWAERLGYPP